jgi:hypothetical protein
MSEPDNNLCISCHQGRASTVQVNNAIEGLDPNTVDEGLGFINVHYFAAGATLWGTEVQGIYEFDGQSYLGKFEHVDGFNNCTQCHDAHALAVNEQACFACHGVETVDELRAPGDSTDYDGDGEVEGLPGEIETLQEALLAALQAYVATIDGAQPIVFDPFAYPYFFIDSNGNGEADADEANFGNRYNTFTPNSLIGAYNYQYSQKDPGAFAHNGRYVIQALIDTIDALGGDTAAFTRP